MRNSILAFTLLRSVPVQDGDISTATAVTALSDSKTGHCTDGCSVTTVSGVREQRVDPLQRHEQDSKAGVTIVNDQMPHAFSLSKLSLSKLAAGGSITFYLATTIWVNGFTMACVELCLSEVLRVSTCEKAHVQ